MSEDRPMEGRHVQYRCIKIYNGEISNPDFEDQDWDY